MGDDRWLVMRDRIAVATVPGDDLRGGALRHDGFGNNGFGDDDLGDDGFEDDGFEGDGDLRLTVPATATELGPMRRSLASWAGGWTTDESTIADLQLAVGEAAANGVEHAYRGGPPGTVDVHVAVRVRGGERLLVAAVTDRGSWRRPVTDNGHRGRGLAMIKALARNVSIRRTTRGTIVSFELPLPGRPGPGRSRPG